MSRVFWALLLLALGGSQARGDVTVEFRDGVGGYAGTEDLHIAIPRDFMYPGQRPAEFATDPGNPQWAWDFEDTYWEDSIVISSKATRFGFGDEMGLLRFRDVFGGAAGQVPPGAEIVSATLTLHPFNSNFAIATKRKPGDDANLHEILVDWDESVVWDTFGPVPGPDIGVDYSNQIVANTGITAAEFSVDVTGSLQRWSQDPMSNRGWVFVPVGTQDVISPSASLMSNVTSVSVDLQIATQARGQLVVTLRHGDYTALLIDRLGTDCVSANGTCFGDDLDVTFDDAASTDIHGAPCSPTLTGAFRPDAVCHDMPLCTGGGTGGLCGQPAAGDWVLTVIDEWGSSEAVTLQSWSIRLNDGVNPEEVYSSSPGVTVPNRNLGSSRSSVIWSSEHDDLALRPRLEVIYREQATFQPVEIQALPATGTVDVSVQIPVGANATSDVTVTVVSDVPATAQVLNSPLVFLQGGATTQTLEVAIGAAGEALLALTHDASFANASLPVTVATIPIRFASDALYRGAADPDELVAVSIPFGSNATSAVNVTVTSSNPAAVDLLGSVGGAVPLNFAAGAPNVQSVTLEPIAAGTATLTASDDASGIGSGVASVTITPAAPIEYRLHVEPYIQLGDAPLGGLSDQLVVTWQTITSNIQGPNADHFGFEYREVGSPTWIVLPGLGVDQVGSSTRLNHVALLTGLAFGTSYDYRMTHYRNGVPLPGQTYLGTVSTRSAGDFVFASTGNTGSPTPEVHANASALDALDPDLLFLNGDNVYFMGDYEHYVTRIFDIFEQVMSDTMTLMVVGNHDSVTSSGLPAIEHGYLPTNGPSSTVDELNYSFDVGDVHFVVVNTGSALSALGTNVTAWLVGDLAATTKSWKVLVTHEVGLALDPYGVDRESLDLVTEFVLKPAVESGVNLYVGGATHSIQRYLPITAVHPELPADPVEWASCSWGAGTTLLYSGGGAWFRAPPGPVPNILDPPMQFYGPAVGYTSFHVQGDTMTLRSRDVGGQLLDEVTINNCTNPADCVCPVCGDGQLESPEECDDGNGVSGDGCSPTCEEEYDVRLYGTATTAGLVSLTLEGVTVEVATTVGQSASAILAALRDEIEAAGSLGGVYALLATNRLISNGEITGIAFSDPGLKTTVSLIPALPEPWRPFFWMALLAASFVALRGATHRRP